MFKLLKTQKTIRTMVKGKVDKSNFQTRNKTRLCDLKTITQELKIRTQKLQYKHENISLLF
jgi:hypothetical protein